MKLGVFNPILGNMPFEAMLDTLKTLGVEAIEIASGGYVGDAHCKPAELLADAAALGRFKDAIDARGLTISALSCHGNPLHPDPEVSGPHQQAWEDTVKLAQKLGVQTVVTFSGLPGGGPDDKVPNWVTCAWPTDHARAVEWQWNERLIPYWKREAEFAESHGVRVAIEMHPGFCVFQPKQALRLREATRSNVGVNFDPSHLFWQGIDPVKAIRYLGDSIYHFHAKDTALDPVNLPIKGVLDSDPYEDIAGRSWVFRSVGYGHPESDWRDMVSALRTVGYDFVMSIEHEDGLASRQEGLKKAVQTLKNVLLQETPDTAWWTG
ncbi:sugar phosphate isomerase/epimerase family protein [Deinococcus altitudinis]|uniref:sugar phosphate isomerase/epimerase family protein n=1 Tax=Deinococcus altitudinis TaxID=468914 RepID=UPI00389250E9